MSQTVNEASAASEPAKDAVWEALREQAEKIARREPMLQALLQEIILDRASLAEALSFRLARKLGRAALEEPMLREVFSQAFARKPQIVEHVRHDILAICERDPAARGFVSPVLYFKGFHAITAYRVAHCLWTHDREDLALYLQSLIAEVFAVDIHPNAQIGCGVMLDHATSFVAGETSVIEDNVSILHEVTLGGTGKQSGDRHPKVRHGVLLGAGAKLLGNIEVGVNAKVGAGSVVLADVPAHTTVAGVPARVVGEIREAEPARVMDQHFRCS
ncbi:MAG: serine O-acetyltransferase [Opitutales bacterium]